MFFKILSTVCYGTIGCLLFVNDMTVETWGFWGVMILVLAIQVLTTIECIEKL